MSHLEHARGRQPVVSTGRGGAGNLIRSPSRGVDPHAASIERGREVAQREASGDRVTHSGRGGAGNIRSPSRDPKNRIVEAKEDALQARLVAQERGRQSQAAFSTGRGGAGNISRSKSRSRSQAREEKDEANKAVGTEHYAHATGRGGFGNISGEKRDSVDDEKRAAVDKYDQDVLAKHRAAEGGKPLRTGKGGAGNYHAAPHAEMDELSLEQRQAHAKVHANEQSHYVNSGRGGAGNIHLREPAADGERGRDHKRGVIGNVFRSLSRAKEGKESKV